jgi:hypothetical protein
MLRPGLQVLSFGFLPEIMGSKCPASDIKLPGATYLLPVKLYHFAHVIDSRAHHIFSL